MVMHPIQLPPGTVKQATEYSNLGRWTDSNQVRWVNEKLQPVGGWIGIHNIPVTDPDFAPVRTMYSWLDKAGGQFMALGSNDKLFAYFGNDPTDSVIDITPLDLAAGTVPGYGYGSTTYGTGRYGIRIPAPPELANHATWSMSNYGEDLLAVNSVDGRIFRWDRDTSPVVVAAPLANAPVDNTGVIVTIERHVVALGAGGDGRRIEWSDRENPVEWAPSATNQAGGFNLETHGNIVGAVKVAGGTLILTTTDTWLMTFIGGQLIYSFKQVGENCGAYSQNTMVAAFDMAFWMGQGRFWLYDGTVTRLECEVLEHVFKRANFNRPFAFSAGANTNFNEVWWFFPTASDLNPTEYVAFSYRDIPHWHIGTIARTAWHDNMVYGSPVAMTNDGILMVQEFGWLDNEQPRLGSVYAETAPLDIANGERTVRTRKIYQDAFDPNTPGAFPYEIELKFRPGADGGSRIVGPLIMDHARGYSEARGRGRQVQVKVKSREDSFWELGTLRLEVVPGGRRGY